MPSEGLPGGIGELEGRQEPLKNGVVRKATASWDGQASLGAEEEDGQ